MIDSNNINVMREKLRKIGRGGGDVQEEIERIDNLIGSSPIPGSQRTITSSLNYLYDHSNLKFVDLYVDNVVEQGGDHRVSLLLPDDANEIITIIPKGIWQNAGNWGWHAYDVSDNESVNIHNGSTTEVTYRFYYTVVYI